MADIEFDCPKCGGHLTVSEKGSGLSVPCPECGQTIQVPPLDKTKPETLTFSCSYCGKSLACSIDKIGDVIECPFCHQLTLFTKEKNDGDAANLKSKKKKRPPFFKLRSKRQSANENLKVSKQEVTMTKRQGNTIITLLLIALGFPFFSMFRPAQPWEYTHVKLSVRPKVQRRGPDAFDYTSINLSDAALDSLGKCGWELVGTYLEMETAFPNFGESGYVTGLQPNFRPQCLVLIFKRPNNLFSAFMDGVYGN